MSLLRIKFTPDKIIFDEAYYSRDTLQRTAANDDGFVIMFSGRLWQDIYEIKCTPGTARDMAAKLADGQINELQVGGDILSIELKADVSEFRRENSQP